MLVEYYDPNPFLDRFPMNNRIIKENLSRDERIDDKFNVTGVLNKLHFQKHIRDRKDAFLRILEGNMKSEFDNWSYLLNIAHSAFDDKLASSVKADYVLYTSRFGSIFDFYPIKSLIEKSIRVVVGGQITTIQTPEQIRQHMRDMGCSDHHLKNLIIVSGFVDLKTDLYSIIDKWKDHTITDNDFSTFWECEDDYIQPQLNLLSKLPNTNINLNSNTWDETQVFTMFDDRCWWGKCRFCFMADMSKNNFIKDVSPEVVAQNIINTCKKYQTNNVYITNDYFQFTPKNEKILDILIKHGMRIGVYGGVLLLKNKDYIDKLNKYISYLMIGLESCDDFALNYINKGYTYKDIWDAFDNVINYCKKDLIISPCVINDLPYRSIDDAITNYARIGELNITMASAGFDFKIKTRLLNVGWPNTERMIDNKYLKICEPDSPHISGNHLMWKYFEQLGLFDYNLYKFISQPLERYGDDGKAIDSDMFIIPETIYKGIFN